MQEVEHTSLAADLGRDYPLDQPSKILSEWFVVRILSGQERRSCEAIELFSGGCVESFFPKMLRSWKASKTCRERRSCVSAFPGYIFTRGDENALYGALCRLRSMIPFAEPLKNSQGDFARVPDPEIDRLRIASDEWMRAVKENELQVGQHVKMSQGPFEGMEGIITALRSQGIEVALQRDGQFSLKVTAPKTYVVVNQ